ncbi:sortase domain-containing protein [Lactococcus hodotermopsidis]|uniref:sortase domain-containing protein n=1 Tax=Pseudolactococcus hodotermopsidis TaxID=2709157 RepID=UPI001552EEE2|nr:sortase [Lactococcus hodotermopsidis]
MTNAKKENSIWFLILGLLAIIAVPICGYFIYQHNLTAHISDKQLRRYNADIVKGLYGRSLADYTGDEFTKSHDDSNSYLPETATTLQRKIMIRGKYYDYKDGGLAKGQELINDNPATICSTWGGVTVNNVADKRSTHFIGHNPGLFSILPTMTLGEKITVYDYKGQEREYKVSKIVKIDDNAFSVKAPKKDYWPTIVQPGKREQVVFETCLDKTTNLLVICD